MGERHAEAFFARLQEEPLYQWISMNKPPSLEWLRARWRGIENRMAPDGQFAWPTWAVRRKSDGMYAYFSPSRTLISADRGRDFKLIPDTISG